MDDPAMKNSTSPFPVSESPSHPQRRGQFESIVSANVSLCREHFKLTLTLPFFPATLPGQFVQLLCADPVAYDESADELPWSESAFPQPEGTELTARTAVLRRPFSLAGRRDTPAGVELDFIHRVVGVGTDWLSRLTAGDRVSIIGPLGNIFTLPPVASTALLVGGGVGIPPMIYLAQHLAGRPAVAFSGAVTRDLLALTVTAEPTSCLEGDLNVAEFATYGVPAVISTDDGSLGYRGYVTQALEEHLDRFYPTGGTSIAPTIYTCGPELMMRRVADIAQSRNIPVQIAVERAMACGMGTCQSCVIKTKTTDGWRYKLACTDGPVFSGDELLW
jgi:dihydroorotate dehydrogenase electron transfer subunit